MTRNTAFKICFALGLDIKDTNDFFRRVQFERSFDCHTINEAVYYFCIKNSLSYQDAERIVKNINTVVSVKKNKTIPNTDILYTSLIIDEIKKINNEEKLVDYISANIDNFCYNNVTAITFIKDL